MKPYTQAASSLLPSASWHEYAATMNLQTPTPARRTAAVATRRPGRRKIQPAKRVLSMKEIERRYSGEWVLIVNPVVDRLTRVQRGEVVCHSRDRDVVDRVALRRRDPHTAMLYVGPFPEDFAAVL